MRMKTRLVMAGLAVAVLILIPQTIFAGELVDFVKEYQGQKAGASTEDAIDAFIKQLADRGDLGQKGPDAFIAQLDSIITLKENEQLFHRFGIALYSAGYDQEAAHVLDIYSKSRKYTPAQALAKAESAAMGAAQLHQLPNEEADLGNEIPMKSPAAAKSPKTTKPTKTSSFLPKEKIYLKAGGMIEGTITKKDSKGLWVKMGEGTDVLWSNAEIEKVVKAD